MDTIINRYKSFLDNLERWMVILSNLVLAVLLGNELLGIAFDLAGSSLNWTPELSVLLLSWVVFLGAGIISRRGGHIALDFLVELLPSSVQRFLKFCYLALIMIFIYVVVYYGIEYAVFAGKHQNSMYLGVSFFYYYLSVPVGGVLIAINSIETVFPKIKEDKISKLAKIEENPLI